MDNIIYFELCNWRCGEDYPDAEPFISWMSNDLDIRFLDEKWVEDNKLCVVLSIIDMTYNFCITATKEWVLNNCPELLDKYSSFLRFPRRKGCSVFGRFDDSFLDYSEDNYGLWYEEVEYFNGEAKSYTLDKLGRDCENKFKKGW